MKKKRKIVGNPTEASFGNPNRLNASDRALWDAMYNAANKYYGDDKFSKGSAWRAVRWGQGKEKLPNRGVKIPNPEKSIILGKLVEYAYHANPGDPQLTVVKFKRGKEPDLLWNRQHKLLLAFPGVQTPQMRNPEVGPDLEREFVRWSQRKPQGAAQVRVPAARVNPAGLADAVVYRSSKWTKVPGDPPGSQEYIHLYGTNVTVEHGPGSPPQAIVFRNFPPGKGKLDVLPAGIVN